MDRNLKIEVIAKFLEDYAISLEKEERFGPLDDVSEGSWEVYEDDAIRLLKQISDET